MAPRRKAKTAAGGSALAANQQLSFRPLSLLARARAQHSAASSTSPLANQRAYHRHLTHRIASLRRRTASPGQVSKGPRKVGGIDLPKRKRPRKTVAKRKPLVVSVKDRRPAESKQERQQKKQKKQQAKKATKGASGKSSGKKRKAPRGWSGRYWKPAKLRARDVKDVK